MLSVLSKFLLIIGIGTAFLLGAAISVYMALRSPEVRVPDVLGKDRFVAENELQHAGLNFRVRATRPSNQVKADTILFQLPRSGEVVKEGQTVAVDVSRTAKEGEVSEAVSSEEKKSSETEDNEQNSNPSDSAANSNVNSNKPKRNKNTNKNANTNTNANSNVARNGNANANTNRSAPNANVNNRNVNAVRNANSATTPAT